MDEPSIEVAAESYAVEYESDLILINSGMDPGVDLALFDAIVSRSVCAKNALVVLVTEGGLADVAYRCARSLQANYEQVTICIPGWCKSAGTLLAIGAHNLIIGDRGELGPLDVQIAVRDEIGDRNSGLTLESALSTMRDESFKLFETYMISIKAHSGNLVTFRTAADLAVQLTVGLMKPVFEQIDPIRLGVDARSQEIGRDYGLRLNLTSQNLLGDDALRQLLYGYPSHSFVIDRTEAAQLFSNVKPIEGTLQSVIECLGASAHTPRQNPVVMYLNSDGETRGETAANDGDGPPATVQPIEENGEDGHRAARIRPTS